MIGGNGNPTVIDASLFTSGGIIEQNKGLKQKFWRGTQQEFDALETKADDTMYIVTDNESTPEILGDMKTSVYDTEGKNTDIFKYVDNAVKTKANSADVVGSNAKVTYNGGE